jgi:hypothetical protein
MWGTPIQLARLAAVRAIVIVICSYGLLYYVYKFGTPHFGGNDYFKYYGMYLSPLDLSAAPAPWIYRQFGAVIVHLLNATGLHYDTGISFDVQGLQKDIWFAALVSNYLALVATAVVVTFLCDTIVDNREGGGIFSLLAGLLCLLSHLTLPFVLSGLAEGWAWFFSALAALLYARGRIWATAVVLGLSITQRETVPVLFAVLSATALLGRWNRRDAIVLCAAIAASLAYIIVRKYIAPVPGYEGQLEVSSWIEHLASLRLTGDIIMQGILSQNILALVVLTSAALLWKGRTLPPLPGFLGIPNILVATAALFALGLAVGIGNNIGRILGILVPLECAVLGGTLFALFRPQEVRAAAAASLANGRGQDVLAGRSATTS